MPRRPAQRSPLRRVLGAALTLGAGLGVLASSLAGGCIIPDRSFIETDPDTAVEPNNPAPGAAMDPEPASDAGPEQQAACVEYCGRVMTSCVGSNQLYTELSQCLAVCNALPAGSPGDTSGNSVACRLSWVNGPGFEVNRCSDVGPMSRGQCGDNCEAFCQLRRVACSTADATNLEFTQVGYCEAGCESLRDKGAYSVARNSDDVPDYDGADTRQCRLGHLVQALADPARAADECISSRIVPRNQLGPCRDAIDINLQTDIDTYCGLVQYACNGDQAVYSSLEECQDVSLTFERGTPEDTGANTLRCRRYHAYNAFEDPGTHCTHAGPTGDGTCAVPAETQQGNCISYCRILERGCPLAYQSLSEAANADPLESCIEQCSELPDAPADGFRKDPRYSVGVELPPGTLKCRTLHAVRALEATDGPECDAAIGADGSACGTPEEIPDPT